MSLFKKRNVPLLRAVFNGKMQPELSVCFSPRHFWKEPNPVCHSVHHTLLGPAVLLHLAIQLVHEGKSPSALRSPSLTVLRAFNNDLSFHQVIYIGCAYATVYLIYMKFRATYDGNHDSFRVEFLVVPVGGLAVLINHDFSFMEVVQLPAKFDFATDPGSAR